MTKRFRWILVGLIVGLVTGGVAYAVVVNPPNSGDRYYACVSSAGVVKSATIKLNVEPTSCPSATDVVHSWNAVGPTGPTGDQGAPGVTGATGATGATAPVAKIITIEIPGTPRTMNPSSTVNLGPVDTSMCRSVSVGWRHTGAGNPSEIGLVRWDPDGSAPISDALTMNRDVVQNVGGFAYDFGISSQPDNGALSPQMGVSVGTSTTAYVLSKIWFNCVLFGPQD